MQVHLNQKLIWKVLITSILIISLTIIGLSYIGYNLYKSISETQKTILENINNNQIAQEQKSHNLIKLQEAALDQTKVELTKTKTEAEKTNTELKNLSQTLQDQEKKPKDIIISSNDLSSYLTGVVQVICSTPTNISSGSGTLYKFKNIPYAVMTNYHVVKGADKCVISITDSANNTTGIFNVKNEFYTFNSDTDEAILTIDNSISTKSVPVSNYNYSLEKVRTCKNLMPIGTPVVVIGYPAYAKRDSILTIDNIGKVNVIYRTVTNGIISGYDTSQKGEANYFISAKIDNGNSGGISLAKDGSGLCVLGLPTWLTVGNYETQGLVQNILNVLPN